MVGMVYIQRRDEQAARRWFGYKPDQHLTTVQTGEVHKMALFLARHMVGMRSQELYDAVLFELHHWQDRATLAESALMRAQTKTLESTNGDFLASEANTLKPCPFCGSETAPYVHPTRVAHWFGVTCDDEHGGCSACVIGDGRDIAILIWNTRVVK